jgi:ribonuclease HI
MKLEIWVDGSCNPKKISKNKQEKVGHSFIGMIVKKDGLITNKVSEYVGVLDNNQAEYEALLLGIQFAIDNDAKEVFIYTDSDLVEKQMNNKYGCYSDILIPYYIKAKNLIELIPSYKIKWIPRKANKEADKLCRKSVVEFIEKENLCMEGEKNT